MSAFLNPTVKHLPVVSSFWEPFVVYDVEGVLFFLNSSVYIFTISQQRVGFDLGVGRLCLRSLFHSRGTELIVC